MNVVNLTPHSLTLRAPDGTDTVIPASGMVARVGNTPGVATGQLVCGVPVKGADQTGEVEGLPEPQKGTVFLVSGFVGAALAGTGRQDVLVPGTGPRDGAVRFTEGPLKGKIQAVTCLKQVC